MSIEAILVLVGILVTVALAALGILTSFFGWWLGREIGKYDQLWQTVTDLKSKSENHRSRIAHLEQINGVKSGSDTIKYRSGPA